MNSGNGDKNGRPPADDEDRSLLIGWSDDDKPAKGRERRSRRPASASSEESGTAVPAGRDDADTQGGAPAAEPAPIGVGLQRLEARLTELTAKLEPDLAGLGQLVRDGTEWVNGTKVTFADQMGATGKLVNGLGEGQRDLDKTIAEIRIQKGSFGEQLTSFDKGVQELRDLWKVVNQRTRALETAEKELAGHYKNWTVGGTDFRRDINALSERLGKGDEIVSQIGQAQDAWTDKASKVLEADAEAHRLASGQVSSDVDKLREAGQDFMKELRKYRAATDEDIQKKQNWIRSWAVPALFLLVMPSLGALGQSKWGFFEAHDDTGGWKQFVWDNHGRDIQGCAVRSQKTQKIVACRLKVDDR